jgi:hypothetical protein
MILTVTQGRRETEITVIIINNINKTDQKIFAGHKKLSV